MWISFHNQNMSGKRKRTEYTIALKAEVLRALDHQPAKLLCQKYDVAPSTLSTWKKQRHEIMAQMGRSVPSERKRIRLSKYEDVEKALLFWLKDMRSRDNPPPIDGKIMIRQAERFAANLSYSEWTCSRGFLHRFCRRYAVVSKRICGESNDCADTSSFMDQVLLPLLQHFNPEDVYNCDETCLFYKLLPHRTYAFRGETVSGGKTSKDRLTLMLCCNMSGTDKLKPVIIGKTKKPQVLKRVYNMTVEDLPVQYYSSKNGWMTGFIFDSWLSKWNASLVRAQRKVLLLLDNAPSHVVDTYSNITIQFLPPNTTSRIQPLDQGILRLVKLSYRAKLANMYLDGIESHEDAKVIMKKFDLKVACDFVVSAWKGIKSSVIQNCFSKAGFMYDVPTEPEPEPHPDPEVWNTIQTAFDVNMAFQDFATADDNVDSSEPLTEAEIVQAVMNDQHPHEDTPDQVEDPDDPDNDDLESENLIKTSQDALNILHQMRGFFQRTRMALAHLDALEQQIMNSKLEKAKCQSSIDKYFKDK